ncbi:MAG: UDP-N-acetylmuramoyl-L-alanyl-D-glutamate--2,6-diaminopimelate ligase, partial [Flavobacteriia bacterium]|nr:UDP-N-acetylmuramoyl-L-alanyl-D-glutamate--2,6-diaminopimelate ligase [Flavobacteriia bacterium]
GVLPTDARKVLVQADRAEAIHTACMMAREKDIVLVAGKGHETTQEIGDKRFDFSDQEHIRLAAGGLV